MTSTEIGAIALTLSLFLGLVHSLGYIFEKLKQPRLVGEILAGVLLGPYVFGKISPSLFAQLTGTMGGETNKIEIVLNFIYWIGLFLLMFISGSETRRLMGKENQKETAWLLGIGTPTPFLIVLGLGLASLLPLHLITGEAGQPMSALLILAIAVSVTSIPVISRIFYDLGILQTRFASLVLGSAVLEDIILWAVLAVATSIVKSAGLAQEHVVSEITSHVGITLAYMAVGLILAPWVLRRLNNFKYNILIKSSPRGYIFVVLFLYIALASLLEVNLVFAAFLAGFGVIGGIKGTERERFSDSIDSIAKVSFSFFTPIYFALVGYKLALGKEFSLSMLLIFLVASSILALLANGFAAKLAGFKKLEIINLAVTTNARGGPGIVLASVAFEAGIINAPFYTTLVLTAIITSQIAGAWLRFVLSKGWPLLIEKSVNMVVKNFSINVFMLSTLICLIIPKFHTILLESI
jgi:Kef-type K+ transport system membrane component KefB